MRIFGMLCLCLFVLSVLPAQTALKDKIDFSASDLTIPQALNQLSQQTAVPIAFSPGFFDPSQTISLKLKDQTFETILTRILTNTSIRFKMINGQLVLFRKKNTIPQYTISGYLHDGPTGEKLIFATVYCQKNKKGVSSNEYGFYSLTLPAGEVALRFNYVGSKPVEQQFELKSDLELNVYLDPSAVLAEVIVQSGEEDFGSSAGFEAEGRLPVKFFEAMPDLGGENDVMRTAQMLPGVQTGADGLGGTFVRGGSGGQNLVLMDGVPIYNPSHLLGIYSVFNSSAVRSAQLFKGGFPARYGGRVSSVFDVRTRDGSLKKWNTELGVGLLSAKIGVDGPIVRDKLSVLVTARSSHSNQLFRSSFERALVPTEAESDLMEFNFYDVNAKLNYKLSDRDRLILSLYRGGDIFNNINTFYWDGFSEYTVNETQLKWGNDIASLRWNHQFGKKLFANTTLTYSYYQIYNRVLDLEFQNGIYDDSFCFIEFGSSNREYAATIDFDYLPFSSHRIRFGAGLRAQENKVTVSFLDESDTNIVLMGNEVVRINDLTGEVEAYDTYTNELFVYLEDEFNILPNWNANLGFRMVNNTDGNENLFRFEPRISSRYAFNNNWSVSASLSRMTQYLHKIAFSGFDHPADIWLPSVGDAVPETSWQADIGLQLRLPKGMLFSVEGYYKNMDGLLAIAGEEFPQTFNNDFLDIIGLVSGSGSSRGLEFLIQNQQHRTGGWLSYSLAWSERSFNGRNEDEAYPFQYDSRHQLKLFLYHRFSDRFKIGLNWLFFSANPYLVLNGNPLLLGTENTNINPPGQLNSLRSDPYHRLDLSFSYDFLTGDNFQHSLKMSIYNVYNRQNTLYHQYYGRDDVRPVYLLPLLPSLQYELKF